MWPWAALHHAPLFLEEGLVPPPFPLYKGCPTRIGEHTIEPFPLFGGALLFSLRHRLSTIDLSPVWFPLELHRSEIDSTVARRRAAGIVLELFHTDLLPSLYWIRVPEGVVTQRMHVSPRRSHHLRRLVVVTESSQRESLHEDLHRQGHLPRP